VYKNPKELSEFCFELIEELKEESKKIQIEDLKRITGMEDAVN
jgi:hypothetical protein